MSMVIAHSNSNLDALNFCHWNTLTDLLCDRATSQPAQIYRFLADGERDERYLTYAELDQQARAIATRLQSPKSNARLRIDGERALLLYPPGLEFVAAFFGCLYAGVIPVPVYLPRNNRHQHRVRAIAQDAQAAIVMTTSDSMASLQVSLSNDVWGNPSTPIQWLATDNVSKSLAKSWTRPDIAGDSLALLQYTSGSTGTPKGVMVSHRNLLHNLAQIYYGFEHNSDSRGLSWLPPYHDMGLIGGILQPLYGGFPITLMSPVHFLQKPKRWLEAIARYSVTSSGGPNFAYDLCIQKITPDQRATIDLGTWDVAFTGAEPIQWSTLEKFSQTFAECGFRQCAFYPCYGLAEATLFVTGGRKAEAVQVHHQSSPPTPHSHPGAESPRVSCGQSLLGQSVFIVNPDTCCICDDEQVGEVWVAGESIAQGYWQRPEETEHVFRGEIQGIRESFLRTGDLGFICQDELCITGRLKDVIIIRGQNHYPQDIEQTIARSHKALRPGHGAVFSVESPEKNEQEQIVVVQEVERTWVRKMKEATQEPDITAEILDAIRAAVSHHHALQVGAIALLKPNGIPTTSSGKIQRQQCKANWLTEELEGVIKAEKVKKAEGRRQKAEGRRQKAGQGQTKGRPRAEDESQNGNSLTQNPKSEIQNGNGPTQNPKSEIQNQKAQSLIHWLRNYAEHHINSQLMDERRAIAPHVLLDFGNQGLLGMQVPEVYRGLALGHADTMQLLQQMGAIDTTLALFVGLNNILGIGPILKYGTSELKAELLPQLATGRELAAFALTEPTAGSNPRSIQSKAVPAPRGSSYSLASLISGTKTWSGSAAWAGVINVFAQHYLIDGTLAGISGFVVRKGAPGLRQGPEALTMGMRSMVQNTVYLDQVPVESSHLLGRVGEGMAVAQDAMMYGRLAIAAASVGGMKRCVQLMVRYSSRRSVSTGRLLNNPVTLTRLSDITMAVTAVETLVNQIAQRLDQRESVPVEAYTACKISAPELFWQAADTLVQTLGGRGYIETNIAPQILRDARVLRIFEGPTETLEMFLGARIAHTLTQVAPQPRSQASPQNLALIPWLRETLCVPHIADCLMDAAAQIQHQFSQCVGLSDRLTAQQWAFTWMGKLATWSILWAGLENEIAQSSAKTSTQKSSTSVLTRSELERSLLWVQQRFLSILDQALLAATTEEGAIASCTQMMDIAATYEKAIGNIEQSLAGEDRELDPWLRRDRDVSDSPPSPAQAQSKREHTEVFENSSVRYAAPTAPYLHDPHPKSKIQNRSTERSRRSPKSIHLWLVHWLSDRLNISPAKIDRQKSFADYGIDSVMAVELAQDLEDWLGSGTPLDVTVAWNFPTIDALAEYLSGNHLPPSPNGEPSKANRNVSEKPSKVNGLSTLDQATETELAQLLAAEIAKVKQRGGR